MKILTILVVVVLAGCAADPKDIKNVADTQSAQLAKPSKPLSSFANYKLRPVVFSEDVEVGKRRTKHAAVLDKKISEKLLPLFAKWRASGGAARSGTLIVAPELTRFRIVGGAARIWTGVFSGQSKIDMTLRLIDGTTNKVIGEPKIDQRSGAWAGAYSLGRSDRNIHSYVAGIVHQYLVVNY